MGRSAVEPRIATANVIGRELLALPHSSGVAEGFHPGAQSHYYGVNTWIITVRIPASAVPPGDRISNSTVTEWEPGLRPVLRCAAVVRVATGRLIPPSTSNPVDGNGLPSDLTWILTIFPDVTLNSRSARRLRPSHLEAPRKCRMAKSAPDPVFRYFSSLRARASSENLMTASTCHGRCFAVCGQRPAL